MKLKISKLRLIFNQTGCYSWLNDAKLPIDTRYYKNVITTYSI